MCENFTIFKNHSPYNSDVKMFSWPKTSLHEARFYLYDTVMSVNTPTTQQNEHEINMKQSEQHRLTEQKLVIPEYHSINELSIYMIVQTGKKMKTSL